MIPTEQDVRASVIGYLVENALALGADTLRGTTRLADLNIDSLSAVEMLWTVERQYGVRLSNLSNGLGTLTIDDLVAELLLAVRNKSLVAS